MSERLTMAHAHSGSGEKRSTLDGDRFLGGARRAVTTVAHGYVAVVMVSAAVGLALLAVPVLPWGTTRSHVPLAPLAAVAGAKLVARP